MLDFGLERLVRGGVLGERGFVAVASRSLLALAVRLLPLLFAWWGASGGYCHRRRVHYIRPLRVVVARCRSLFCHCDRVVCLDFRLCWGSEVFSVSCFILSYSCQVFFFRCLFIARQRDVCASLEELLPELGPVPYCIGVLGILLDDRYDA